MALNTDWPMWTNTTTTSAYPVYINAPVTTTAPQLTYVQSGGHVPSYEPPSLAENELAWLRRRVTEVTDLFPVAA